MLDTTRYTDRGKYLGPALQAAVTGLADGDSTSIAPPHSATQVHIMANIMHAVAQPGGGIGESMAGVDLVHKGLGDSFGNMAAAYMPEISQKLYDGDSAKYIFLTNSEDPSGLGRPEDVGRFLSAVSEDPAGRAGIVLGESIYTSGLMETHLSDPSLFDGPDRQVLESIGSNAGLIEGIVAHSVADSEVRDAVEGQNAYNEDLKAKGDYAKTWISTGMTFLKVPERLGGDVMGGFLGGGIGAVASAAVDHLLDGQKMSGARDEALYQSAGDLYDSRASVSR
ncbi:hypothetical protein JS756_14470 [Streptomyces actuosus]|uniref:Uncharacterized protein n=2 Tax=Streptomyces actuosus TaxID=1885 RepID=A0ABS2VQA4_STRAS|nr:hypothetical protein [Streptomyces actuosus]